MRRGTTLCIATAATLSTVLAACTDDGADSPSATTDASPPDAITLVAYDSFPTEGTALNDALAEFTDDTGIAVELLIAGDTGSMLSKAALTAGNPEGDVMWGVDNTYLSRAVEAGVFAPYESPALDAIPADLRHSSPTSRRRRSTTATSVSTTTSAGSPSTSSTRRPSSTICSSPTTPTCSWSRTRPPHRRAWRSCWRRSPRYGDGWQRLLDVADRATASR